MLSFFSITAVLTIVSIAFPPLAIAALACWVLFIRQARRNIREARDTKSAKTLAAQERRYNKAVRYFQ